MRRRTRERVGQTVPAGLRSFTGTTNRDRFAWLRARAAWWNDNHDPEDVGDLQWVIDSHDMAGDPHWCGTLDPSCADADCLCAVWPEYAEVGDRAPSAHQLSLSDGRNHP